MMELTINGQVYQFNFGMGFLREANKLVSSSVEGTNVKKDIGARYMIARVIDGEADALVDLLDVANKGQSPRVTKAALDAYIDNSDTDIDQLFDDTMDFLGKANATKKMVAKMQEAIEEAKAQQNQN